MAALPVVLILAAVEEELRPARRAIETLGGRCALSFVVTGVGKAAAACETALAIRESPASFAIQIGCAGAFPSSGLAPGDVVVAAGEVLGDDGVDSPEGFLDLRRLGLPGARTSGGEIRWNEIPTSSPRPETWREILARIGGRYEVRSGRLVTVSTGSGTSRRAAEMESRWAALAESMEGAAAAIAAGRLGCPFYEVRGISNLAGDRERGSWEIGAACDHAAEVAIHILDLEIHPAGSPPEGPGPADE